MSLGSGCLQDKIVLLSDANAVLDAAAHEAKAGQSRIQQEKVSKAYSIKASSTRSAQQHLSAINTTEACLRESSKAVIKLA